VAQSGALVPPTRSHLYVDHLSMRNAERAGVMVAAGLFHHRKVFIRLSRLTLHDDLEKDDLLDFSQSGVPPAEVVAEYAIRYNPYVRDTVALDLVAAEQWLEDRTPAVTLAEQDVPRTAELELFAGPVFDAMDELELYLRLVEVDDYRRAGVAEDLTDASDLIFEETVAVALANGSVILSHPRAEVELTVRVEQLY
jgi:hypothetical protein